MIVWLASSDTFDTRKIVYMEVLLVLPFSNRDYKERERKDIPQPDQAAAFCPYSPPTSKYQLSLSHA